jgi:hypothetical protein
MLARLDHELPVGAKLALVLTQRVLVQRGNRKVAIDRVRAREAELLEVTA